jgi:tyrosyl-tRNA synthetase
LDIDSKLELVAKNTAEIVTLTELKTLLETKSKPRAYWGFECSGPMHLGMGFLCGAKIKNMIDANFDFIIFLADWHSWINNKLGGDMKKIRTAGEYFKHCFTALGINPNRVKYLWASDLVKDVSYWEKVVRIAKSASLQRTWRALPIMGREMSLADIETAWVYYPCMQVADIFQMELDVACAGIDQRKAHMLARDIAEKHSRMKPICIHTPLLMGLGGPEKKVKVQFDEDPDVNAQINSKMSKSVPINCIYIHDQPDAIKMKIQNAYCPPREIQGNPILEIARHTIFPANLTLDVPRPAKYGGSATFNNYEELETAYRHGKIHPLDLKNGITEALVKLLTPVREYFQRHPEPLELMRKIEITR